MAQWASPWRNCIILWALNLFVQLSREYPFLDGLFPPQRFASSLFNRRSVRTIHTDLYFPGLSTSVDGLLQICIKSRWSLQHTRTDASCSAVLQAFLVWFAISSVSRCEETKLIIVFLIFRRWKRACWTRRPRHGWQWISWRREVRSQ